MKNWKTTLFGFLIAAFAGYTQYKSGTLTPSNISQDIAIIGLGAVAKDSNVTGGSVVQPSPAPKSN
jgi:hypothetical protein